MTSERQKRAAAEVLARTGNVSAAARSAEVNRSTVSRWLDNEEFQKLVAAVEESGETDDVSRQANRSLSELVEKAVSVIERALDGDKSLVSSGRLALDVVTKAAQLAPKGASQDGTPPLADLLSELDRRAKAK